jgi:hypothetical protein
MLLDARARPRCRASRSSSPSTPGRGSALRNRAGRWQDAAVSTGRLALIALLAVAPTGAGCLFEVEEEQTHRPLVTYFNRGRSDNFTGASFQSVSESLHQVYQQVRIEGSVATRPGPGLKPLELYWHPERGDFFLTATEEGRRDALRSGYELVRVEGYAHEQKVPGSSALKLFWSEQRGDNYSTVNPQGEKDALAAGYVFVRVEAYVDPPLR